MIYNFTSFTNCMIPTRLNGSIHTRLYVEIIPRLYGNIKGSNDRNSTVSLVRGDYYIGKES